MKLKRVLAKTEVRLFVFIWAVYALFASPAGGVGPNRYLDLVHSVVNERRVTIDSYHENTIDKSYYRGHYYIGALPGPAFVALPSYLAFKAFYAVTPASLKAQAATVESYKKATQPNGGFYGSVDNTEFFLSQWFLNITVLAIVSALGSVFLFKTVRELGYETNTATAVTLFYAFGTHVFFYSTVFMGHVFTAAFGIIGLYLALTAKASRRPRAAVLGAGLLAGAGLTVEYASVLIATAILVWLFVKSEKRFLVPFAAGFAVPIVLLMIYNWVVYDNPLASPYSYASDANRVFHSQGFFGITYPHPRHFLALLFSPERGLFLFAPITLLGVIGLLHRILKRQPNYQFALLCAGLALAHVLFYSAFTVWGGGSVFGPRFLVGIVPILLIGVAFAGEFLPRYAINIAGAVSIAINLAGAQFGFADSPVQHLRNLITQGPTLPFFQSILSHATSRESSVYLFASQYRVAIAAMVTLAVVAGTTWFLRDGYGPSRRRAGAPLIQEELT